MYSELNSIKTDNGGSTVLTPSDDEWYGDGSATSLGPVDSTDQDNVDPALLCVHDLALKMTLSSHSGNYIPGEVAVFEICIYNQGIVQSDSIIISDYIPVGYTYSTSNIANGWKYDSTSRIATYSITSGFSNGTALQSMDSICIEISLLVERGKGNDNDHVNRAEISGSRVLKSTLINNGHGSYLESIDRLFIFGDYDGIYDQNEFNDAGGQVYSNSDNSIFGSGHGSPFDNNPLTDEDDADPAAVVLARKSLGNQVWWDQDNSGFREDNETGIDPSSI